MNPIRPGDKFEITKKVRFICSQSGVKLFQVGERVEVVEVRSPINITLFPKIHLNNFTLLKYARLCEYDRIKKTLERYSL